MDPRAQPGARAQAARRGPGQAGLSGRARRRPSLGPSRPALSVRADGAGRALAPAKVNLFLHVGPVRPDGYHPVASWMVFADIGDELQLAPAPNWNFRAEGEMAGAIGGGENLVERAARLLFQAAGVPPPGLRLTLRKSVPVAAGLGGGSSDAGAALRLLNARLPEPLAPEALEAVAAGLGADGPACLQARPVLATGVGEVLGPAPSCPPLPAVLVNPRRPSPTGDVYRAYDAGPVAAADLPDLPRAIGSPEQAAAVLRACRNDLQAAASALEPAIGEVLNLVSDQPETLLARMSGSGATCFALCATRAATRALASRITQARPDWWVRTCLLSGQADKVHEHVT
ncbi:MAG: 4-(cytidine 5'-diphospho)-2-C-methyl-D-erythritol kinase [Proteobacteria bacterium]|nr:4-(cytidine 5'-diphospho)-2-C-methyl-D-erythritol kinase [Pseudomonadota bacterium]